MPAIPGPRSPSPQLLAARANFLCAGDQSASVSNTFFFKWETTGVPSSSDWTALAGIVRDFFITVPTGASNKISAYLGQQVSTVANAHEVAIYQIDTSDPHHYFGSPVSVLPFTTTTVDSAGHLPQESACCLSFRAAYGTDPEHSGTTRPRASDRGRVYIGPLGQSTISSVTVPGGMNMTVVAPTFVTLLGQAAKWLFATANVANFIWSVWSRKEAVFKNIFDFAVNNDFDTQRRRSSGQALQVWNPIT
jgi:hypothetical protein